ncbi:cytochrome P450 [Trametes versicolor FP-101664 SS1]|uniref:cytochrome P450 n=1 Tax=Trametes versicolor (strain FP-101664) TaxID=717944 RepID=UPI0004624210|nr:cytochrome P450 [Trametes versicolor FP-101664 SS1]EIW62519.1 cytochrome P450 [Trametes versicolor FP-101664 SS1]
MAVFNHALFPGEYLAEKFPSLRFLPSWFPGAKFKRKSKVWVSAVHRLRDVPWERTVAKIRGGTAIPSIATSLMKDVPDVKSGEVTEEEVAAKKVTATAYAAGADTTLSTMQSFFLAMASNPDAQRKAQAELDAVVGRQRLPTFADRESLPYVCALISECLRWRPVAPLGFPHRSTEDDCFRGYFIPKGTVTIANVWAYSRDTRYYPDPEAFSPERFLKDGKPNPDVLDPAAFVFGYGRRICPGRHFADASLFMLTATVLHTLTISAPLDAHGHPVKLEGKMTAGVISYPEPFEADIKSRGSWAEALVRESCSAVNV